MLKNILQNKTTSFPVSHNTLLLPLFLQWYVLYPYFYGKKSQIIILPLPCLTFEIVLWDCIKVYDFIQICLKQKSSIFVLPDYNIFSLNEAYSFWWLWIKCRLGFRWGLFLRVRQCSSTRSSARLIVSLPTSVPAAWDPWEIHCGLWMGFKLLPDKWMQLLVHLIYKDILFKADP